MKKTWAVIVRITGYGIALWLCVLFALYMSAAVGWTFFYILAITPFFSFVITLVTALSKSIEITSDVSSNMVYKNEKLTLKITVKNKSFFPVPSAVIKINSCEGFSSENENTLFYVSVSPRSYAELETEFKAEMWGTEKIGIESAYLSDFLHFIKVPLYKEKGEEKYKNTVRVFPDIPDVPSDMPLIKSAAEKLRFSEESEDTKETDAFNLFGGNPGYTHREYQDGDPIKRINWKLSSKKDVYMVRLDDETESMQQVIALDSMGGSRKDNERAVEGLLAVVFSLFRLGFGATVWYKSGEEMTSSDISDYGDVAALQTAFAGYSFSSDESSERIPVKSISEKKQAGGIMLFTPRADASLAAEIEEAQKSGSDVTAVAAGDVSALSTRCYIINEDYSAEEIN